MTSAVWTLGLGAWLLAAPPTPTETTADQPAEMAEIAVGATIPALEGHDAQGQAWKSSDHIGAKVVVFYAYPGDFTGGCVKQALAFRARLKELEDLGVEVVGISGDEVATHRLFKDTFGLTHTLLADPDGSLASRLGIPVAPGETKVRTRGPDGKPLLNEKGKSIFIERQATLARWTLVVDQQGKLVATRQVVNPAADAEEVLKLVESLRKNP